ncbi:MAG: sulfotransferase [Gammaproteobacteria bacterium]|nr:sulfotransferase [Gammaproteobacteria bacterium]
MIAQLDSRYLRTRPSRAISRLFSYALFEGRPLTTKGRWINPLLKAAANTITRRAEECVIDRPVFILGSGRSGTTVLGKMLSLHRSVGYLNEPKLLWHVAYPNEDLNGNYTEETASYRLETTDATQDIALRIRKLYATYLAVTRNDRVVDKYPELIFRTGFVKKIFPDARFIFLIRNGFDACRSVAAWSAAHGQTYSGSQVDWWGKDRKKWTCLVDQLVRYDNVLCNLVDEIAHFTDPVDMAAIEWMLSANEGLKLSDNDPDKIIRIQYEMLISSPDRVIPELLDFCGLEQDPTIIEYAVASLEEKKSGSTLQLHPLINDYFLQIMSDAGYSGD